MKTISKNNTLVKSKQPENNLSFHEFMYKEFEYPKEDLEKYIFNEIDELLHSDDTRLYDYGLTELERYLKKNFKGGENNIYVKLVGSLRFHLSNLGEYHSDYIKDARNLFYLLRDAALPGHTDNEKLARESYIKYLRYKDHINWKDYERTDKFLRCRENYEKKAAKRFPDLAKKGVAA